MELYRVKELIELATTYIQIGYKVLDAILKAENELEDTGEKINDYRFNRSSK